MIYVGEELAAVGGLWVCAPFFEPAGKEAWKLSWHEDADIAAC